MTKRSERRVLSAFRAEYSRNAADLEDFDEAYRAQHFETVDELYAWCRAWWEDRLQGRALEVGEKRLRGTEGAN